MCMFCAAIPATAAVGAKLNVDQLYKEESQHLPIPKITALLIGLLVIGSAIYHTLAWRIELSGEAALAVFYLLWSRQRNLIATIVFPSISSYLGIASYADSD